MLAPTATGSGPRVARLFVWSLLVCWAVAFWSWGIQILPLVGRDGVLPLADAAGAANASHALAPLYPPLARALAPYVAHGGGDALLLLSVAIGLCTATVGLCNVWPRRTLAVCTALYAATLATWPIFFPNVGDKLLLEASVVGLLLPRNRTAPAMALIARLLVVRLYVGMGVAQWLAAGLSWQRGEALVPFLQNAPLVTLSGWYVAHLPAPLLQVAAKASLLVEICLPFLAFGPRAARLTAALVLTCLQVVVANLVNDGLFAFVATALHLFLLDEADIRAMQADLTGLAAPVGRAFGRLVEPVAAANLPEPWRRRREHASTGLLLGYLLLSGAALVLALQPSWRQSFLPLVPNHLGFTYTHVATPVGARIEPSFAVLADGRWQTIELWHQPGDPWRAPRLVLPHQPRLDAALSAAGRNRDDPRSRALFAALGQRLCRPAGGLQRLLRTQVPTGVRRVRVQFYSYAFADWAQHRATGVWWNRAEVDSGVERGCP